ncbi:MAG: biotin carboxylase N-terminal domain-containing protein, partial [Myxococcota bacterium]|nr:biotin carboxylase N-terminal domain-containing protein [Myxococcota bacterium]
MRILIANRGEIARRIQRTAHALGHETVAVFAEPDARAPFVREATRSVRIGPADLAESYLSIERLLDAARSTGADAVHPGYGFLAENAAFARGVVEAGLTWIGPHAEAIERMGSKIEARRIAKEAGVPTIPGFDASQEPADLARAADEIGYPILVKAAAGGGGKGIRIAHEPGAFDAALTEARAESQRAFGDSDVIVERYVERPRHVEVQVVGDRRGGLVELGTRECSVQRRYQKLLEEAPAPNLPDETRAGLRRSAADLARAMGYDSTGTVEFIVDDASGDYFFLEMNTRLQVEHPVTECVTGLDLVALQLRAAANEPLGIAQEDVVLTGHAFEARINAEDSRAGFAPQIGRIQVLRAPEGARFDTGVEAGSEVTPYYDPMLAKLIVSGPDRESARRKLASALEELLIGGIVSNTGFQRWLVEQPPVIEGRVTTRFLDESPLPQDDGSAETAALAAAAFASARSATGPDSAWGSLGSFRTTPHRPDPVLALEDLAGAVHDVRLAELDAEVRLEGGQLAVTREGVTERLAVEIDVPARRVHLNRAGETLSFRVLSRTERFAPAETANVGAASAIVA